MSSARDVCEALHRRYNKPSQGRPGEQYVCIEEARSGAGFRGNDGQCDFLAINTWQSRGMELIGHEIKVSMSDWKAELDQPEKAERFARFCRRWYVAAPADLATRIKDEVPPAWGLLSISDTGRTKEVRSAPSRQPDEVPAWWWVGWLAQIDRQHKRRLPDLVQEGMAAARREMQAQIDTQVQSRRRHIEERVEALRANADRLKAATGIDLHRSWPGDLESLNVAWELVRRCPSLPTLVDMLRRTADALEPADYSPSAERVTRNEVTA
jgi:hypothetical protein